MPAERPDPDPLTAGHYGYGHRRVHRDDFARVLSRLLPSPDADRVPPRLPIPPPVTAQAAKHCRALAARRPGEPLAILATRVADLLDHPSAGTRGGPGQLVLYAAAHLCREEAEAAATQAGVSVAARLENAAATRIATLMDGVASDPLRYNVTTDFDSVYVRGARQLRSSWPGRQLHRA